MVFFKVFRDTFLIWIDNIEAGQKHKKKGSEEPVDKQEDFQGRF